jgi:serine O-acetyltransferase
MDDRNPFRCLTGCLPFPEPGAGEIAGVVDALCALSGPARRLRETPRDQPLPSRDAVIECVETLRAVLFPGYFGTSELTADNIRFHVGAALDRVRRVLLEQVRRGICFSAEHDATCLDCVGRSREVVSSFLVELPAIRRTLATDVAAAFESDPAATSPDEAIFCYPGVKAVTSYRLAHALRAHDVPLIPRMITEHAHATTGVDIHPGAVIGDHFFIDHGTGVVIGETAVIGNRVRLFQGVTLGARSFPLDAHGKPIKGVPRHPILEDDVIVYSGATILGRITVGQGSVIGGNVWLTRSVPAGSNVTQAANRQEHFLDGAGI